MQNIIQRYIQPLGSILIIIGLLFTAYIGIRYIIVFLAPFIIATLISIINEPVVCFLEARAKMSRKLSSIISLTLSISIIAALAVLILYNIYGELIKLQHNLPSYIDSISYILTGYYSKISSFYDKLPYQVQGSFKENLIVFLPKIQGLITSIAASIISSITSLPRLGIFVTVTLLSSYFISSDKKIYATFYIDKYQKHPEKASIMLKPVL